ncbi:GFA family protein [Piscinibacter sp. XHJ-5]|uniref:GFA family protein n=1 Tax=Piscinibacter sp. XHJ-5 TaxID=3037797 RepID=UPI002452F1C0|nr:GFA family protein [Piscinibacter sp. XHJ-5]
MRGSCLCGTITYEASQLDSPIRHCACRTCRKAHSAAFNTSASVRQEHFKWLSGAELLSSFESSPGKRRYFCSRCGSQMVAQRADSGLFVLRVATLDDDPGQTPQSRIWGSHDVPWLAHGADLPVYPQWGPDHR